uniref:PDZ domain-containing protein n=1 Tax=Ciona savignyi TaxID=51511 RepID=H2Y766_CIOSA
SFPIYISSVVGGSEAEAKGVKRGDLLLEVNGQNFEKLTLERATSILLKNTDLSLTLKTSLFAFKEMMSDLANPQKKKKSKNDEKNIFFPPGQRGGRVSLTMMNDSEVFDQKHKKGLTL